jgi:hypothetical protein
MSLRDWLVPAATGLAGLAAGFLIAENRSMPAIPAVILPHVTEDVADARPAAVPVTLDDLRRIVREELAAMRASHGPEAQESAAESPADQDAAATQARAVLDAALSRRSWTETDREALAHQFVLMSPAQRDEWMQKYAQAVNQGRLIPDSERPPF